MNYVFFVLIIVLISCSNNKISPETKVAGQDSVVEKVVDSLPSTAPNNNPFKGGPGFLSQYFNDTVSVEAIQGYVSEIDKQKFKDSVELENEEFMENMTDGGGSLTGYFRNKKLVKIKEWYGLSWGILQVSFYFDNDTLVFVNETEDHFYIDSNGTDHSRFGLVFRGQYYFHKNKLFDEVSLGHNRFEIDENDAGKEYPVRAAKNKTIILSRKQN